MKKTKPLLEPQEVDQMTENLCKLHKRFAVLWLVGVFTGLRISDLLQLRPRDIGEITWVEEQKTKRIRGLFIKPALMAEIQDLIAFNQLKPDEFLFFSTENKKHKPISRQWAHRIIAKTARNLRQKGIGTHSMRKTYACDLYFATGSLEAVKASLGHKDISTTFLYVRDALEAPRRKFDAL